MPSEEPLLRILSPAEQSRYEQDGIVFPIPVLSPGEVGFFRQACDELERELGGRPRTVEVRQMHLHFPWAHALATHPRVLDAVEDVLGSNLVIWATELFAKHPRDAAVSIGWHRDRTYLEFDPQHTTTAWVALGNCTQDNGCMCVLPERQRQASEPRRGGGRASGQPAVPPEAILPVVLQAGQMSLHDVHILHGSGPNLSGEKRVGVAIRFVTPQAQPREAHAPAILARGQDDYGHFCLVHPPAEADYQEALLAMRHSARRHLEITLENVKLAAR
jgi:non-haem Fe2+, alpha-ketoglutarate-dependent halogenase